ncbi:MAG TPA: type II CAAX endopeptidase family protein [Rhodothermales bacterium]
MTRPANASEERPDTLRQRVASFPLTRMIVALIAVAVVLAIANGIVRAIGPATWWVRPVVTLLLVHAAYVLYVRLYERRSVAELDRWAAGRGLILGIIAGISLLSVLVAALTGLGAYEASWRGWEGVGRTLLMATAAAYVEEIIFRGILYRLLEAMTGTWIALVASAGLFGVMHLSNPDATVLAAGAIALEAGLLLASLFAFARRLWAPIGLHLGWNFGVAGVYGLAVSGVRQRGILEGSLSGPEWLTGGAFGIEASALTVVACSAAATLLLYLAAREGRIVRPMWKRRPRAEKASNTVAS